MDTTLKIAVTSRSFSRHPILRKVLQSRYANVTFNDEGLSLKGQDLIDYLRGHDKAITALEVLDDSVFEALPELKVVGKYGVGLDMIDLDAMQCRGVKLGWTGGVNKRSVSELVIAFAIALLRHVPAAHREVLEGTWRQHVGRQISGRTFGIIGCGHIGKDLVPLLNAFGCKVLVHDLLDFPEFYAEHNVESVGLEDLLRRSEIVTLHLPLDESTHNFLTADRLSMMRSDAVLINVARGGLVDETALYQMLKSGRLAAAAFDVFANEPPEEHALVSLPNFLVTPHIGGSSEEAIVAMGMAAIEGLETAGDPIEVSKSL